MLTDEKLDKYFSHIGVCLACKESKRKTCSIGLRLVNDAIESAISEFGQEKGASYVVDKFAAKVRQRFLQMTTN